MSEYSRMNSKDPSGYYSAQKNDLSGMQSVVSTNLNQDQFRFSQIDNYQQVPTPVHEERRHSQQKGVGVRGASGVVREVVALNHDEDDYGDENATVGAVEGGNNDNFESLSVVDIDQASVKSFQMTPS